MLKQRIYFLDQPLSAYEELTSFVEAHPGCCDELWFWVVTEVPTVEKSVGYMRQIRPYFHRLKAAGLKVSVELKTFGDQTAPTALFDFSGLPSVEEGDFSTDQRGHVNFGQFCWNSQKWRSYRKEIVAAICRELEPYAIYFDDDIRVFNYLQPLRCFCPTCLKKFNALYRTDYTRETLASLIDTDMEMRQRYLEFSYASISDFCREMGETIAHNSAATCAGVQHGSYSGEAFVWCLTAFHQATGRPVMSRSGGGAYSDANPNDIVEKSFDTQYQLGKLPDFVTERCNEIENYPHVYYCKSTAGLCLETTLHLASGFNSASYMLTGPHSDRELLYQALLAGQAHRPYWQRLTEAGKGCRKGGLCVVIPKEFWKTNQEIWMTEPWKEGHAYHHLGIPVTYAPTEEGIFYLTAPYAATLSEAELLDLCKKSVVTFGEALSILEQRGYGALFGVKAHPIENAFPFYEMFTDHPAHPELAGQGWGQSLFSRTNHYFTDRNGTTEVLSVYQKNNPEKTAAEDITGMAASVLMQTAHGGTWFVQGYREEDHVISYRKKRQIDAAIEAIGGLSCRILSEHRLTLYPLERADGTLTSVTVANASIEPQEGCELEVRHPSGKQAVYCDEYGNSTPLPCIDAGDKLYLTLPRILPWTAGSVFFED